MVSARLAASRFSIAAIACLLAGCLFPSLEGFSAIGGADTGTGDAATDGDAGALNCPNASDPTLEGYYRLNEGTGTLATDCSPHGRNGLMVNDAGSWTTGLDGSALVVSSADGGTGCIDVPLFPNITGALTVTAWVRVDKAPALDDPGFIVAKSFNLNTDGWRMSAQATDFGFALGGIGDAGLDQFGSNALFQIGVWTYVTMVFDPTTHDSIYINGALDMTKASPSAIVMSGADLRIGCRGDSAAVTFFDGALDEVRIYSRALSAAEIMGLYVP